jgi:hypothetical protein
MRIECGCIKTRNGRPLSWQPQFHYLSYIVRDANNFPLAYVYLERSPADALRLLRKSQRIKLRLGGRLVPFARKPRRMHERTYRRLRAQARAADADRGEPPRPR